MMEAARTSEMSVDNYFTWQYIPEDNSELHTRRRENFKSHIRGYCFLSKWQERRRQGIGCVESFGGTVSWKTGDEMKR
jgi:hypothetical protein